MLTKSLIATATATAITVGTLAVSTTTVSAHSPANYEGLRYAMVFTKKHDDLPGWSTRNMGISQEGFLISLGDREVCSPIYGQEWGWNPSKGSILQTVKVGERCEWRSYGFNVGW
jgi:hypothetical protein